MAEEQVENDITTHLSNKKTWMRLVYMILYGIVFEIGKFVTGIVALVQFLFTLFTGKAQPQLQRLGFSLAEFYRQIVEYVTFRTDERPYPWAPWPQPDVEAPDIEAPAADPAPAKAAKAKKPAAKTEPAAAKPAKRKKSPGRPKKTSEIVDHTDDDAPSA